LTNKIFDEFDGENDNSIPARDLGHYSVGKQNYIYEEFKKLWAEYLYEKI
jgi:hypothetical protein